MMNTYGVRGGKRPNSGLLRVWRKFAGSSLGSAIVPWLELVRLPNLFTVIGDTLTGACLASAANGGESSMGAWNLTDVCFCSMLLYCFGLIQNDLRDIDEDRRLRPERPLPAKRIPVMSALLVALACVLVALLLALLEGRWTLLVAVVLLFAICMYNYVLKKLLMPGALAMGLCRALDVLLGATLVKLTPLLLFPVVGMFAYIIAVTVLADGENRRRIPDSKVYLPCLILFVPWLVTFPFLPWAILKATLFPSFLCIFAACLLSFLAARQICDRSVEPPEMRRFIGTLLGCLIPWQASWIMFASAGNCLTLLLLAAICWVLMHLFSKVISQS